MPPGAYGAQNSFPKTVESVSDWLDAISLGQYKDGFATEGVEPDGLRMLTNATIKNLIPVEGHRRRLLLALNALETPVPPTARTQDNASLASSDIPTMKYNSTSSIYIDSTISTPCIEEIIFCVSIVIHDRVEEGERVLHAEPEMFSSLRLPEIFDIQSKPLFNGLEVACEPTEEFIFQAIKTIYSIAEFSPECLVISLLYTERLRSLTGMHLLRSNWQPILLAAMIVAQKVWDDKSLLNVDFSLICSAYSLKDINSLERHFLELVQYNVSITASLYASYYFELRTLCEKAERTFTLKPLSESQTTALVSRSEEKTEGFQASTRRVQSLGTFLSSTTISS